MSKTFGKSMADWQREVGQKVGGQSFKRCYEDHPALSILAGTLVGGACASPIVADAHSYIGLDYGMRWTARRFPWTQGAEFLYPIRDMQAPDHPDSFIKLVNWIVEGLKAGQKIHVGCIGGHGRTGTVIAAVVKVALGHEDAITWVRANYCKKAVESKVQVDFLHTHFGIKRVAGAKEHSLGITNHDKVQVASKHGHQSELTLPDVKSDSHMGVSRSVSPLQGSKKSIWG